MEVNPLSIILVKSDSKGDRLLFRYPYDVEAFQDILDPRNGKKNPYALNIMEDLLQTQLPQTSNIQKGQLTGFTDEVLSTLFAVKPELCHRKFELKVNDVRFVGHPTLLPFRANKDDGTSSTILINIVFALQALASHSVVKCYYDLSERLGKALRHEEKRCSYLSEEMKIMIQIHDEMSAMDSDSDEMQDSTDIPPSLPAKSPFHLILQKSSLAQSLKMVFEDLSSTGIVQVRINQWVLVSFCLPHKAHQFHNRGHVIEPETIERCLRNLRPYHGILLLVEPNELLETIPLDSNPCLIRILLLYSPLKSLQTYALESDMSLAQVFQVTGHLVYWAKATIIYPLCESNVYVIAPDAQVYLDSPLVEKFAQDFPGSCLIQVVSMLSLPAPLWFHARAWAGGAALLAKCMVWMLQRHLLLQLHTYVQFLPTSLGPPLNGTRDYYCDKHNGIRPTISDSFVSLTLIPQTAAYTPSDDSSNDYINFKAKDHNDSGFRSNRNHYTNGDSFSDHESKSSKNSYNSNIKAILRSPNSDSALSTVKSDNPKTVFRENSLIFGDITCESSVDSHQSSPQSLDSVDNIVKINVDVILNKDRKDSDNSVNSDNFKESLDRSNTWNLDSTGSSFNSYNNIGMDIPEYMRCPDVTLPANDSTDKFKTNDAFIESDFSLSKLINGVNDIKLDEKNQSNGIYLNLVNEKDKLMLSLNTSNSSSGSNLSERRHSSIKHLDTSFQPPTVVSAVNPLNSCDVVDAPKSATLMNGNAISEPLTIEMLLADFTEEEKTALFKIPAAHNPDDLTLICTLYKKGYFRGEQHLEEIMFMENLTRSQVLQLLDKFRDVLITYETEDPTITMLYSNL